MKLQFNALSFHSTKELRSRIELLPSPPRWKSCEVEVPGGSSKKSMELLFRDGFECFSFLFGNPIFQDQLELSPRRVFDSAVTCSDSDSDGSTPQHPRVYSEIMTGNWPWEVQVMLVSRCQSSIFLILILIHFRTKSPPVRLWVSSYYRPTRHI